MLPQPPSISDAKDLIKGANPGDLVSEGKKKLAGGLASSAAGIVSGICSGIFGFFPCCRKRADPVQAAPQEPNKDEQTAGK